MFTLAKHNTGQSILFSVLSGGMVCLDGPEICIKALKISYLTLKTCRNEIQKCIILFVISIRFCFCI